MKDFRKLVVLYYCGEEAYYQAESKRLTAWSYGESIPDEGENVYLGAYKKQEQEGDVTSLPHTLWTEWNEDRQNKDKQNKVKLREGLDKLAKGIRYALMECYRNTKTLKITAAQKYWLNYISDCAEAMLLTQGGSGLRESKLNINYLCESTFRMFVAYIAEKYVDMGKAVYHFTNLEPEMNAESPSQIGQVLSVYQKGITSFDYERIKAEENLDRDLSLYIAFAACTWSHAVCEGEMTDTTIDSKKHPIARYKQDEEKRRILQFFGGKSRWEEEFNEENVLFKAINACIRLLRNSKFHYTAKITRDIGQENKKVCNLLLQKEVKNSSNIYRKKYYSNNVWMFYSEKQIWDLMDILYSDNVECPAQIPAFKRVVSMKEYPNFIASVIKGNSLKKIRKGKDEKEGIERMDMYRHALYFLLKEIYYKAFLQNKCSSETSKSSNVYFEMELDELDKEENLVGKDKKEQRAIKDFKDRIKQMPNNSLLGEICQRIMTDYNQQNQLKDKKAKEQEIYKHYPLLLCQCLRNAFAKYVKENFAFIREPAVLGQDLPEENFLKDRHTDLYWHTDLWSGMMEEIKEDSEMLAWYITGHFLDQKYLNQLIGCLKNYNQYVTDIHAREEQTENNTKPENRDTVNRSKEIIHVLEFVKLYCGMVSEKTDDLLEDYFVDASLYSKELSSFVNYDSYADLATFCNETKFMINKKEESLASLRIYYNEQKPVVNRNLIYAMMYGNTNLLGQTVKKVDKGKIQEYVKLQSGIQNYKINGKCKTKEEQKTLKNYQNVKNQVELTNLVIYTELINEFMSQLVSWAYLQERDFMYFQLGLHYMILHYSDEYSLQAEEGGNVDDYRQKIFIDGKINIASGAILYQIYALYAYHLPFFAPNNKGNMHLYKDMQTSGKLKKFEVYANHSYSDYQAGMELFICPTKKVETSKTADVILTADGINDKVIDFRNNVDHFNYYNKYSNSILEMYSYVYDQFFSYNRNFKKSTSFVLKNILGRYFIDARFKFSHRGQTFSMDDDWKKGLASQNLTYSTEEGDVKVDARNEDFLENVYQILNYKK